MGTLCCNAPRLHHLPWEIILFAAHLTPQVWSNGFGIPEILALGVGRFTGLAVCWLKSSNHLCKVQSGTSNSRKQMVLTKWTSEEFLNQMVILSYWFVSHRIPRNLMKYYKYWCYLISVTTAYNKYHYQAFFLTNFRPSCNCVCVCVQENGHEVAVLTPRTVRYRVQ